MFIVRCINCKKRLFDLESKNLGTVITIKCPRCNVTLQFGRKK